MDRRDAEGVMSYFRSLSIVLDHLKGCAGVGNILLAHSFSLGL